MGSANLKRVAILLGSTLIVAFFYVLRNKLSDRSTGRDKIIRERNVQFASPVTRQAFDQQAKSYTFDQVNKLIASKEYREKVHLTSRFKNSAGYRVN